MEDGPEVTLGKGHTMGAEGTPEGDPNGSDANGNKFGLLPEGGLEEKV